MATATLNSNTLNATGATITITTETLISLYVFNATGAHSNRHIGLEVSPDGTNWILASGTIKGERTLTYNCIAQKARVIVTEAEGATSTVNVHLLAK